MAEIPVEKNTKSSFPWWLIPLLLLLLLLPLIWFCSRNNDVADNTNGNANRGNATTNANRTTNVNTNSSAMVTNTNSSSTAITNGGGNANGSTISVDDKGTTTGARVTDVNMFGGTADKNSLNGRGVDLTKVKVNRVLSDRVFTVTSGSGEMFVMLDENLDSGGGKEQQIKMRPGQTVNIGGDFRRVPDANTKEETQNRDLNKAEYAQMKGQQVYLHAQTVADAK